ncbi:MAG: threonylcarbamoyl-AMP synthase [Sterolibacterium sp.]|nr:threonylcarbamoyl-AMP synthase [Sterolibacterium sp.]
MNPGRDLERAVALLRAGELVAFPTETVYGLGADAANPQAVGKIFAAKGRPADHPLIVHLPGSDALEYWAREIPATAHRLAAAFWPGPLTLILKRAAHVIDAVTGGQDTIGLRVPEHRLALALLRSLDDECGAARAGIAAPSANRFGRISPTTAAHVREELGERVALILDGGPCLVGIESTIVDLTGAVPRILRPGAISAAALEAVLGVPGVTLDHHSSTPLAAGIATGLEPPRVSGTLAAHYAPSTPLSLLGADALYDTLQALSPGERCAVLAFQSAPEKLPEGVLWQSAPDNATAYAHDLYATLRRLDAAGCDRILVEMPPSSVAWRAVVDRLQRAACGSGVSDEMP